MSKCSLKKLKVEFNNPNLPVLETMQQFTLDAITLSGNTGMSDAQKYALNHFFYQVGAIRNTTLWQKVKFLFLPMICGDNTETALNDYVSNTVIAASTSATPSFVNHGLHYDVAPSNLIIGSDVFSGSSNDLTVIQVSMATSFPKTPNFHFMIDKGSPTDRRDFGGISLGSPSTYYLMNGCCGLSKQIPVNSNTYYVGCVTSAPDSMYSIIGGSDGTPNIITNVTFSELSSRQAEVTYSNNYLRLGVGKDTDMGLVMATSALSTEEATSVLNYVKGLKQAFSQSNS